MDAQKAAVLREGKGAVLRFERVSVLGTGELKTVCVCVYLDDTSNGDDGLGNTAFLRMTSGAEGNMLSVAGPVEWFMMGAGGGKFAMPDTAKVVVTADSTIRGVHGLVGGAVVPLKSIIAGPACRVPIYNGFMDQTPENHLLDVEFVGCRASMQDGDAAVQWKDLKVSGLFKRSELPTRDDGIAIGRLLPMAINDMWIRRVRDGVFHPPTNAPNDFGKLEAEKQIKILNEEPCLSMFRMGSTQNARLSGLYFPHAMSALPGMHNELEQPGITNDRCLFHAYHAALTMFRGYGWGADTLLRKVAAGPGAASASAEVGEDVMSFLAYCLCAEDTLASTQKYVSDYWVLPHSTQWIEHCGEDWQMANASRACWDHRTSTGSPTSHNDCESRAAKAVSLYLAMVDVAGGKGCGIIMEGGMEPVRSRVAGSVVRARGFKKPPSNHRSLREFARWALLPDNSGDLMVNGISMVCGLLAHDDFRMNLVLGEAYGAARTSGVTRRPGGHAYCIATFMGMSCVLEGTASVLNRMHVESPEHTESMMLMEKALCTLLEQRLPEKKKGPSIHGMMVSSSIGHTDNFYGRVVVASYARTYAEATAEAAGPHGAYLFTGQAGEKMLKFGANPEDLYGKDEVVLMELDGGFVDDFAGRLGRQAALMAGVADGFKPFSSTLRQAALGVRELSCQRVPKAHWEAWMDRMYGRLESQEAIPRAAAAAGAGQTELFFDKGRVLRVVATFESSQDLERSRAGVEAAWKSIGRDTLAVALRQVVTASNQTAMEHATKVVEEIGSAPVSFTSHRTLNTLILTATLAGGTRVRSTVYRRAG